MYRYNTFAALMKLPICKSVAGAELAVIISSYKQSEFRYRSPPHKCPVVLAARILLPNSDGAAHRSSLVAPGQLDMRGSNLEECVGYVIIRQSFLSQINLTFNWIPSHFKGSAD
jgi:hypothetical protein